jgi:hypothetical protein
MVRYLIGLLTLFCFINTSPAQEPSSTITFDERIYDFGTILEKNGKVSHVFVFHNNGLVPVAINDISSGCGCIGRILSKGPVAPGGKGVLTIIFDPAYKSGFFSKEVVVLSNEGKNYNRIWVNGKVIPAEHPIEDDYPYNFGSGLYLRLKVMAFGYLKAGETKQMELPYANDTNSEMTLKFIAQGNNDGLKYINPGKIGPKARGVITFSYLMPFSVRDEIVLWLEPYVNGKKLTDTLEIKILNGNKLNRKKLPERK